MLLTNYLSVLTESLHTMNEVGSGGPPSARCVGPRHERVSNMQCTPGIGATLPRLRKVC